MKITTNRGPFTGSIGPVRFDKGVGYTSIPSMLAFFRRDPDRFTVEPEDTLDVTVAADEDSTEGTKDSPDPDPYDVSVAELRKLCGARGIPQVGTKAELQARLRAADTTPQDDRQE